MSPFQHSQLEEYSISLMVSIGTLMVPSASLIVVSLPCNALPYSNIY